jgi:hypothetical protein
VVHWAASWPFARFRKNDKSVCFSVMKSTVAHSHFFVNSATVNYAGEDGRGESSRSGLLQR